LAQKVGRGPLGPSEFVFNPQGEEKMSEVLADFVEPYAGMADTMENHRKLLGVAATAWNTALLPADERDSALDSALAEGLGDLAESLRLELRALIEALIARKDAHFVDNRRAIVDFTLQGTRDGYHLSVASTLESKSG
jgi:hypothetical protein